MEDNPYRGPVSRDLSGESRPTRSVGRAALHSQGANKKGRSARAPSGLDFLFAHR